MGRGQKDGRRQPPAPRKHALPSWNQRSPESDDFAPFAAWDGEDFSRVYGDPEDEPEDTRRATVVVPAITLPSVPAVQRPTEDGYDFEHGYDHDYGHGYDRGGQSRRPPARAPRAKPPEQPEISDPRRRKQALAPVARKPLAPIDKKPRTPSGVDVVLVPGGKSRRRGLRYRMHSIGQRLAGPLDVVRVHRRGLTIFALTLMLVGVVANTTGLLSDAALLAQGQWSALANLGGTPPPPTPRPAPDITDPAHYVAKYGFDYPTSHYSIPGSEWNRLAYMLPFAYQATAAYDQRYHQSIEPELVVWWTHAEGIRARINYSNCANNPPRSGYNYFTNIENCAHASFWQLGYGNQFSTIYVLKNAFRDMHGDPNDPQLVQKVGQWVLNYDRSQGTYPPCGGYSCTFPARTIDSIMSGIDMTTGVKTTDNWWASVLSRDPAINCYMIAHALTFFNHEATKRWKGNYYYEPYWGYESNKLGDILTAWPALRRAAHL